MIAQFFRPASAAEAVRLQQETPNALFLAGGTHLLSPALRGRTMVAISIEGLLPSEIRVDGRLLSIGALATLQDLVERAAPEGRRTEEAFAAAGGAPAAKTAAAAASGAVPAGRPGAAAAAGAGARTGAASSAADTAAAKTMAHAAAELALLGAAASSMASRNARNRATIGGNVVANRPTSCLVPALLALGARLRLVGGATIPLADYLVAPGALIEAVEIPLRPGRATAYRRWARTEGDLSGVAVAVALAIGSGRMEELHVAATGVREAGAAGSRAVGAGSLNAGAGASAAAFGATRLTAIEARFGGASISARDEIERIVLPLLESASDLRASAAYRCLRGAQLVAEALVEAAGRAATGVGGVAGRTTGAGGPAGPTARGGSAANSGGLHNQSNAGAQGGRR